MTDRELLRRQLIVPPREPVRLADRDPGATGGFAKKNEAREKLEADIERLSRLQDVLFAQRAYALLVIFQGMDTAGKDGAIKHVMSGMNPLGINVFSFGPPSDEELRHDFLWRSSRLLPERGRIAIFNRSYYEEVLIVRVHPELLEREQPLLTGDALWTERFGAIDHFERHLVRSGTIVLKFFLHISKEEQRRRLLERLADPTKTWKFSLSDTRERAHWNEYMSAYEAALRETSTEDAPWYVVPADHKWFTRMAVADVIVARLEALPLAYPEPNAEQRSVLAQQRRDLGESAS